MAGDILSSGTVMQCALKHLPSDYADHDISHPVIGIILNIYRSDEWGSIASNKYTDGRGPWIEANVLVVNDGSDSPWPLPNVLIPPSGTSGVDNFYEELPKPCTGTIDGSDFCTSLQGMSPREKLDGDWCVVDFIGGSIKYPYIQKWWPHHTNRVDPATSGNNETLVQGRRLVRRFQGTRAAITSKGTVMLDTSQANRLKQGRNYNTSDDGGDVKVTVKNNRTLDVNFNLSVFDPNEPDFLWGGDHTTQTRSTDSTHLTLTKDDITAIAGEMVNIIAQRKDVVISTPQGKIQFGVGATEPMVLGNQWKTAMEALINAIEASNVATAWGPSGYVGAPEGKTLLDQVKANLPQQLSEFIFGKKTAG